MITIRVITFPQFYCPKRLDSTVLPEDKIHYFFTSDLIFIYISSTSFKSNTEKESMLSE